MTRPPHSDRQFAAKVYSFNAGYESIENVEYDIIGNLDADITFDSQYFAYLLEKFRDNEQLGVAGTPFVEDDRQYNYQFTNIEHVSGACQMFRKACFAEIGGYVPIKVGGIDWVAVTTARMKGWQTRTFTDKVCFHHRKMGTGAQSLLMGRLKLGREDYTMGGHPVWQLYRGVYQMTKRPFILGGLFLMAGYAMAAMRGTERAVSNELMTFHRREQMQRLKRFFLRK